MGNPEEKIKIIWNTKIKPGLCQKYPSIKTGIYNKNVDVEFLIQEIDRITKSNNNIQMEKSESTREKKLNDIKIMGIQV